MGNLKLNHPYPTALGSGQHSGLNKLIIYPMTTLKPVFVVSIEADPALGVPYDGNDLQFP